MIEAALKSEIVELSRVTNEHNVAVAKLLSIVNKVLKKRGEPEGSNLEEGHKRAKALLLDEFFKLTGREG